MAAKQAGEDAAKKTWAAERERLVRQTRELTARLEVSAEENQRLLSEKHGLQVGRSVGLSVGR